MANQAGHAPDERPLVAVAKRANALRIVGADRQARQKGLYSGLAFADAKARVPQMRVVEHDEKADRDVLEAIADWCDRYSPIVTSAPPDMIMLDVTGVPHLFGGEEALLSDIEMRLARQGFAARLALCGTARSARAQCRFGKGGIFQKHDSAEAAGLLPIEALECGPDTLLALSRAGLTRLADLIDRPRKPLAARFGKELTETLALILEEFDRPLTPRRQLPDFTVEQRFADPIGLMDDISLALDSLTTRLCRELETSGQGGRSFELSFYRADGKVERIGLLSGQALKEPKVLKRLLEMRLDALADPLDPGFGFDMMRLSVLAGDGLAPRQSGLDGTMECEVAVAELVDRLSARFGAGSVHRFVPENTHLPERASRSIPAISDIEGTGKWGNGSSEIPTRPLFLFYPAHKLEVVAEVPDGPPRRFRWRGVLYDVAKAEGPERIAPEWWRETKDRRTRDYFRVEDESGRRFWLFRYGLYGREAEAVQWFLQGVFS